MIKKRIAFTVVFVVIICAVLGFIISSILSDQRGDLPNSNNNKNTNEETNSIANLFAINCEDVILFEGSSFSFSNFVVMTNKENWKLSIDYSSNKIEINKEEKTIKALAVANDIEVKISIEPLFDVSESEEYKDTTFPVVKTFNVSVLPTNLELNYEVNTLNINEFDIKITCDEIKLSKEYFKIDNLNDFNISNITLNNDNEIKLKSVNIKNALEKDMNVSYSLSDSLGTKKDFTSSIKLKQEKSNLIYSWQSLTNFNNILYLTKGNEYSEEYPNKATISIEKNYDIENSNAKVELVAGIEQGLLIDGLTIKANTIGFYTINLVLCDVIVETFEIEVKAIPVEDIILKSQIIEMTVGEILDLHEIDYEIISHNLAIYDINFTLLTNNQNATITNNFFTSEDVGEFEISISAGNVNKTIKVIVKEVITENFALVDENQNEIKEINLSLNEIMSNPEIFIKCKVNNSKYLESEILITSENSAFLAGEFIVNNGLSFFLKPVLLKIGDMFNISIVVSGINGECEEAWIIKINII